MSAKSADFDLLLAYADRLREAGYLHVRSGTCEGTLSPTAPTKEDEDARASADDDEPPPDAMNDPASFGSRDDFVPGFSKLREKKTED